MLRIFRDFDGNVSFGAHSGLLGLTKFFFGWYSRHLDTDLSWVMMVMAANGGFRSLLVHRFVI